MGYNGQKQAVMVSLGYSSGSCSSGVELCQLYKPFLSKGSCTLNAEIVKACLCNCIHGSESKRKVRGFY